MTSRCRDDDFARRPERETRQPPAGSGRDGRQHERQPPGARLQRPELVVAPARVHEGHEAVARIERADVGAVRLVVDRVVAERRVVARVAHPGEQRGLSRFGFTRDPESLDASAASDTVSTCSDLVYVVAAVLAILVVLAHHAGTGGVLRRSRGLT